MTERIGLETASRRPQQEGEMSAGVSFRLYLVKLQSCFRLGDLAFEYIDSPLSYRRAKAEVDSLAAEAKGDPAKQKAFDRYRQAALRDEGLPDVAG